MPAIRETEGATQTDGGEAPTVDDFKSRIRGDGKAGGFLGWTAKQDPYREPREAPDEPEPTVVDEPAPTGEDGKESKAPESAPADKAEPAKGDEPKASDGGAEAKPKDSDPVAALLEKYGSEDNLADAYIHLQRRFTARTEDAKELQAFVNAHFDVGPDGALELKTEAAARRLGRERQASPGIDEKAVRAEVEGKYRALGEDTEDVEAFLQLPKTKKLIEDDTKRALAEKRQEIEHGDLQEGLRVARVVDGFFKANPAAEKFREQMDEWLDELPQKTAMRLLREGGTKYLTRLYRAAKAQSDFEPRVREAFEQGLKVGKEGVNLKSGAKTEAGPTSPRRGLGPGGGDEDFKSRVVGSGKRGVMDSLLKAKG